MVRKMFNTLAGYFGFVVPATIILALGIIFEDDLVHFEDKVKTKVRNLIKGH